MVVAVNNILPFAQGGGANTLSQAAYAASTVRPVGHQPGIADAQLENTALLQLSVIAAAIGQYIANRQGVDVATSLTVAQLEAMFAQSGGQVVGSTTGLKASLAVAGNSITFSADEIVLETVLGGPFIKLASFSQTLNIGTTGAGGMDSGAAPANGFIAIYAIYNPTTGTRSVVATNAATLQGQVYGGASMPSGYTYSALISVWPTNGTPQLKAASQSDRNINFPNIGALSTSTVAGTYQTLSVASIIPVNAKRIKGNGGPATTSTASASVLLTLASDAQGSGNQGVAVANQSAAGFGTSGPYVLDIITPQTVYWSSTSSGGGTPSYSFNITQYSF